MKKVYNSKFVKMIQKTQKEFSSGKGIKMDLNKMKEVCNNTIGAELPHLLQTTDNKQDAICAALSHKLKTN